MRTFLLGVIAALVLAIVTVTVTRAALPDGGTVLRVNDQRAYQVVLTNVTANTQHPWLAKTFPGLEACETAIGNLNVVLEAVSKIDSPQAAEALPRVVDTADVVLMRSVNEVVSIVYMQTGTPPNFRLSCAVAGQPA